MRIAVLILVCVTATRLRLKDDDSSVVFGTTNGVELSRSTSGSLQINSSLAVEGNFTANGQDVLNFISNLKKQIDALVLQIQNQSINLESLESQIRSQALSVVPQGALMFFNLSSCPAGWAEYTAASGRYLVAMPNGGNLGASVGQALLDQENRPTGDHGHDVYDPGHTHTWTFWDPGYGNPNGMSIVPSAVTPGGSTPNYGLPTGESTTQIQINTVSGSPVGGTNAPYSQFLLCIKS